MMTFLYDYTMVMFIAATIGLTIFPVWFITTTKIQSEMGWHLFWYSVVAAFSFLFTLFAGLLFAGVSPVLEQSGLAVMFTGYCVVAWWRVSLYWKAMIARRRSRLAGKKH